MQAAIITKYGSPDVLQLTDMPKPTPKDNEILIRVIAATVGPADCAFRKGDPFLVRLIYGLRKPRTAVLGSELAGEVEAVGKDVTAFKRGDPIFGMRSDTFGAHAEYTCLPDTAPVAIKPANMNYEEAVGICDGGLTALTFLRDVARVQLGQKVLVNGASGAVGSAAVQLARYFGAEVTGVCSTTNVGLVKSLGADHVVDYTREDFTRNGQTYDVIFDAVGKSSFSRCKRALTRKGVYMTTVPSLAILPQMLLTALSGGKKAKFAAAGLMQNQANLNFLKQLAEAGQLRAVIDRRYPLEQIADAHRYVDTERKKGNVIINVAQQDMPERVERLKAVRHPVLA